jgi:hypothetical protein
MKRLTTLAILITFSACAQAAVVQPDSATASSSAGSDYLPINTINGSGLAGPVSSLPNHEPYSNAGTGNHWTSDGSGPTAEWIQWSFLSPQNLDTIYLWNHQSTTSLANNAFYDVTAFSLTFYNSSSVVLGTYSNTLAVDSPAAQAFNFGYLAAVSSVRFDVDGTQGSTNYTGLAEVAFNTASAPSTGVPDAGATAPLLAGSMVMLVAWTKRRRPADCRVTVPRSAV